MSRSLTPKTDPLGQTTVEGRVVSSTLVALMMGVTMLPTVEMVNLLLLIVVVVVVVAVVMCRFLEVVLSLLIIT